MQINCVGIGEQEFDSAQGIAASGALANAEIVDRIGRPIHAGGVDDAPTRQQFHIAGGEIAGIVDDPWSDFVFGDG